eukprot:1426870-Pyramimonas_sp.AAC.1
MKPVELDYYKVLGVSPHASEESIKDAYRRMAMLHHPDRFGPAHRNSYVASHNSSWFELPTDKISARPCDRHLNCSASKEAATARFKVVLFWRSAGPLLVFPLAAHNCMHILRIHIPLSCSLPPFYLEISL